jgi:hypothetical protein
LCSANHKLCRTRCTERTEGRETFSATIELLRALDREETGDEVVVTIVATDGGGVTSSTNLTIFVQDENDNTPTFLAPETYKNTITEASVKGQYIATVHATDPDMVSLTNVAAISADGVATGYVVAAGLVLYRIVDQGFTAGQTTPQFQVDPVSGVVTTTGAALDREVQAGYDIKVQAYDNGIKDSDGNSLPSLTSIDVVSLTLSDINDNAPLFSEAEYAFSAPEHVLGAVAGTVVATDADANENQVLTFSIESGNELGLLAIDASTGAVSAVGDIDREVHGASITIRVKAVDAAVHGARFSAEIYTRGCHWIPRMFA